MRTPEPRRHGGAGLSLHRFRQAFGHQFSGCPRFPVARTGGSVPLLALLAPRKGTVMPGVPEDLEALLIRKTLRVPLPQIPDGDGGSAARQFDAVLMCAG